MKLLLHSALVIANLFTALIHVTFPAFATEQNDLAITSYGSFFQTKHAPNALFFIDEISANDSFEFRRALRNHSIDIIVLLSPGGSVWEGLNMAGIISDKKLTTYIPYNGTCASACSYMFFAGDQRKANGRLGVHQFSADRETQRKTEQIGVSDYTAQFTVSEIIGFLNEFDTPPFVFEKMFSQKNMYFFNDLEISAIERFEKSTSSSDALGKIESFLTLLQKFADRQLKNTEETKTNSEDEEQADSVKIRHEKPETKDTLTLNDEPPNSKSLSPELAKAVQRELKRLGCYVSAIDGIIGPKSLQAVASLAKSNQSVKIQNIDQSLFYSEEFLTIIKSIDGKACKTNETNNNLQPRITVRLLHGTYIHVTTCGNKSIKHSVSISNPNLTGQNVKKIPSDVTHNFSIEISSAFGPGFYGLSNGLLGHWSFSGWVRNERDEVTFTANPYAYAYSKTRAEGNIDATYKVSQDGKGYSGVDGAGCKVIARRK